MVQVIYHDHSKDGKAAKLVDRQFPVVHCSLIIILAFSSRPGIPFGFLPPALA
jgi:hypothetical protein